MRWLATRAAVVLAVLVSPTVASGYTFGDWASDQGYDPNDVMPITVNASYSSIDSLSGIGDFNWTSTPTTELLLVLNQISSIETGAFSELTNLTELYLAHNSTLTKLNLAEADFSSLTDFHVWNENITSVSLNSAVVNQVSLIALMEGDSLPFPCLTGIGELDGITEMDLGGIDFVNITDLAPLYAMDELTDLWLVDTLNLVASELDALLNSLATIQGTGTEGILYLTRANYDAFNLAGDDFLVDWHGEPGHHVELVLPGDFNGDGVCDGADFLMWQRDPSVGSLAAWQSNFGRVASPIAADSAAVPEPATLLLMLAGIACLLGPASRLVPSTY